MTVHLEGENRQFSANKPTEIVCKTAGSRPLATITWWKGNTKLKKSKERHSEDGNITTSVLTYVPSAEDNGIYLTCRAENSLILGSAIEDSWKLDVLCKCICCNPK